jgi:hypothetical protein
MRLRPRRTTLSSKQGRLEIAAAGGAGRRSAKNVRLPHGSIARSAPCGAAAPLSEGHTAAEAPNPQATVHKDTGRPPCHGP